jgi:hypothetical protein
MLLVFTADFAAITHYHVLHIKSSHHTLHPHRQTSCILLYFIPPLLFLSLRTYSENSLLRNSSFSYKLTVELAENATRFTVAWRHSIAWKKVYRALRSNRLGEGVRDVTCGNAEVTWPRLAVSQSKRSQSCRLATRRHVTILSSHSRLGLPTCLVSSCIGTKILYASLICPMRVTCPANLILGYRVVWMWWRGESNSGRTTSSPVTMPSSRELTFSKKFSEQVTLQCSREVLGSNLRRDTGYHSVQLLTASWNNTPLPTQS